MEFRTHLLSPRLIVLAAIFALVVLGASYGFSQPQQSPFGNAVNAYVHPAIVNESGVDHYWAVVFVGDSYGVPAADEPYTVYETNYSRQPPTEEVFAEGTTDSSGFARVEIGTTLHEDRYYEFRFEGGRFRNSVGFYQDLRNQTFTMIAGQSGYSGPFGSESIVNGHILALDGTPPADADIFLDDEIVGHPDENGFFRVGIPEGEHTFRVEYQGYSEGRLVNGIPASGPAFTSGADRVLFFLTGTFLPLLLPIVGIALSFDAIARERAQGSLELLLSRRIRREGILTGKFLGTFASAALPVVAVLLAGIGIVTVLSGISPDGVFAVGVVGACLFLLAVYVLLMLILSTVSKNVGTAIVFAVLIWFLFTVVFTILTTLLLFVAGFDPASRGFADAFTLLLLANPNTVFQLITRSVLPGGQPGFIGFGPTGAISSTAIAAAAILWVAVPAVLAIVLFRLKAES